MLNEYKLSTILYGHSADVRCVAVTNNNCITSGSRDKTCKYWKPNGFNANYTDAQTYKGHKNYVSSICCLSTGLILSGGNDKQICVYKNDGSEPIFSREIHSNTVCSIKPGIKPNTFITSSWDCTAKLWKLITSDSNVELNKLALFEGHSAAVWSAIQLPNGNCVTGSADKDIIIWNENGQQIKILKGHTDCVRGLTSFDDKFFLSASNDASIKQWNFNGECLKTFYGHGNYIYGISSHGSNLFVTSGEDRVVNVWQLDHDQPVQTIILPAQSIWSIAILPNGDFVTGSSDGLVRIFTRDPSRVADEQQLKLFEEEVASLNVAASQELGGVKISDLPSKEVLYEPGKHDGQTKLVREGATVICYSWSAADKNWNKIGDVMGAAGGTQATSGKTLYEGKEYDYIFSVDIEDDKPPLKLPYNRNEDPWSVAQQFIHKNNLSQYYLDQVANFIVKNSSSNSQTESDGMINDYLDPFTGGSRYVPQNTSQNTANSGANTDPFTGASSYTSTTKNTMKDVPKVDSQYFPHKSYLFFDQGNVSVIYAKLIEFNKKSGDNICFVDEKLLDHVVKLATGEHIQTDNNSIVVLVQLLQWPHDIVFPVLDITRLALRHNTPNMLLCSHSNGEYLVELLRKYLDDDTSSAANRMLTLRILTNMFSHTYGEALVLLHEEHFLNDIGNFQYAGLNRNCQIALSTFLLNLTVALLKAKAALERITAVCETLVKIILNTSDTEAQFRCYVALGTLLMSHPFLGTIRQNELLDKLISVAEIETNDAAIVRNQNCARQLITLIP